jgi:hypothetical protein
LAARLQRGALSHKTAQRQTESRVNTENRADKRSLFERHPKATILLVNLALFASLVLAAEGAARLWAPGWLVYRMESLRAGTEREVGSDAQWKVVRTNGAFLTFVSNSGFTVSHREYIHRADIDELGGRRLDARSPSNLLIPCFGDSFTFGVGVSNSQTFLNLLQPFIQGRLLNLGVPGSALPNQRFILENRHETLGEPPLYVFCFFLGNDFADIQKHYLRNQGAIAARPESWLRRSLRGVNRFVLNSMLRQSYLVQFVRQPLVEQLRRSAPGSFIDPVFSMMDRKNESYRSEIKKNLERELDALARDVERLHFKCTFVLIPDKYQVCADARWKRAKSYGLDPATLDPLLPNHTLEPLLAARGFAFFDVTEQFSSHPTPERLFYNYDNHITVAGHELIAETLRVPLSNALHTVVVVKHD